MLQGWLEGYLLTRTARLLQLLRGLHPHHRFHGQPARQVAQGDARNSLAQTHCLAQLFAVVTGLAARPQRLLAPRPRLHRPYSQYKKAEVVRVYLSAGRQPRLLSGGRSLACATKNISTSSSPASSPRRSGSTIDEAVTHCTIGMGVWKWASNDAGSPDVVMACSGDVPTLEALAAVILLRHPGP